MMMIIIIMITTKLRIAISFSHKCPHFCRICNASRLFAIQTYFQLLLLLCKQSTVTFLWQKPVSNLLHDERFSRMFTDADYQVDVLSEEYRLLNPVISKMEKRLEDKQSRSNDDDDEVRLLLLLPIFYRAFVTC